MQKGFQFSTPPPFRTDFDIPIFQKTYDFYKELSIILQKFPKKQRYSLGKNLDGLTLEYFESLFLASRAGQNKVLLLEESDAKLEILKVLLRLAKDTQSLDNKTYTHLESYLQEIGKMLGGWLKHTKQTT